MWFPCVRYPLPIVQPFKKEKNVHFIHISVTLRWERNTALYSSSWDITKHRRDFPKPCLCIQNKNKPPERRKNILSFFFIFHSISLKLAFVWSKRREPFHSDLRLIKTVLHRPIYQYAIYLFILQPDFIFLSPDAFRFFSSSGFRDR